MAYQIGKFSFSINNIKYTDIKGFSDPNNSDKFYIRVAGTAQMIRQWLKQKYTQIPSSYFWVSSSSFANGDSVDIHLNRAPEELYDKIKKELKESFEYGSSHYGAREGGENLKDKTDEGKSISYGTKYLSVTNRPPSGTNAPSVDWSLDKEKESKPASNRMPSYPMGEVLVSCSGWIITKKTLPDGRIVYNAKINPETPKNRGDWNEIKGEIYTETGFKWGRFSAFEKWGLIASEAAVIKKLCDILGKYYQGGNTPAPVPSETPETLPTPDPQPEQEKNIGLYVSGEFIENVASEADAYEILTKNFGEAKLKSMVDNNQVYFNMSKNRIDLIRDSYQYGKKWGVPKNYGNELQFAFINKGYKVYVSAKNSQLVIYKNDMVSDGFIINDNGGEFNIDKYGYNISVASVNYVIGDENNAVSTSTLAGIIDDVYDNERGGKGNEEAPTTTATKSKEDIEKAINGLQYLADNGNEKAIKAIKGLQYLLNK
jgi:hypothetical protein